MSRREHAVLRLGALALLALAAWFPRGALREPKPSSSGSPATSSMTSLTSASVASVAATRSTARSTAGIPNETGFEVASLGR